MYKSICNDNCLKKYRICVNAGRQYYRTMAFRATLKIDQEVKGYSWIVQNNFLSLIKDFNNLQNFTFN